ncbi:MAG: polynucleotide adenylyltransferase PcnB [Thioalkalivibrionaceae bacterium]
MARASHARESLPREIPVDVHGIERERISIPALRVLYRLHEAGHRACLVGGAVRDLLLGEQPKDFDVATDAHPEQVKRLFRNCRLIGRRFRLAHVTYGREIVEVATFRAPHDLDDGADSDDIECVTRDNCYGTIEQDAERRDFTVNALYYDPVAQSVLDFGSGLEDLAAGELRLIGDPRIRLCEDPVRMLRAVRFVGKHGFRLDPELHAAINALAGRIVDAAPARLFDEVIKLFHNGRARQTFLELEARNLFEPLFPQTKRHFDREGIDSLSRRFLLTALDNTDRRVQADQGVNPAFLYAALLWGPVQARAAFEQQLEHGSETAMDLAIEAVLREQSKTVMIPRRFGGMMREIWEFQPRLESQRDARHVPRLLAKARFRAAYDFYCLRAQSGQADPAVCEYWTEQQGLHGDLVGSDDLHPSAGDDSSGSSRRGRSGRRRGGRRRGGSRATGVR